MSEIRPALFRFAPRLADALPWCRLGSGPTPLQRFTLATPAGPREILVKREDLSGEPYGGNKVRKLEFILADAGRKGARRLITAGAAGSHHALATALYGKQQGFDVSLVLFPQSLTQHVRDVLMMSCGTGAELCFARRMEMVPIAIARTRMRHWRARSHVVAPGGSDAIGTLGYVSAGLELAEQLSDLHVAPARIHVAAGTLGTAAGLALGLALAGRPVPIAATRITSRIVTNERALRSLLASVADLLRDAGVDVPDPAGVAAGIELRHAHIGAGYGRETEAGRRATAIFAEVGLRLDPTYTAKAAADLLDTPIESAPALFMQTLSAVEPLELSARVDAVRMPAPFRSYLGL
jgi:1-aminocyclopropane-1-carboxylate deaminase/D-cysteine desulfhydrase-like pyridoxal-dependent ACC family enzyme